MKLLMGLIATIGLLNGAQATETNTEKLQDTAKTVKRTAQIGLHRTKEALCGQLTGDTKVECLAKKAQHRLEESKDAIVDKGSKVKNKIDSDAKQ